MIRFIEEVAVDLAAMLVNPDVEPLHPSARNAVLAVAIALLAVCAVRIMVEDGCIYV